MSNLKCKFRFDLANVEEIKRPSFSRLLYEQISLVRKIYGRVHKQYSRIVRGTVKEDKRIEKLE